MRGTLHGSVLVGGAVGIIPACAGNTLRGDYAERRQEEMRLLREIDAQKYLLDVAKRYKIPRIETEQTKAALAMYEKELRRLGE